MISFNILGVCTSRDIFSRTNSKDKYTVNKYTLGFSPFFIFDEGAGIDPKAYYDVADKHKLPYSNFMKRAFLLELNRQAIDYIHSQKSDYLLLDSTVFRFTYFKTADNKYFVNGIKNQRTEFYKVLARELKLPPVADPCVPCDFLDDDEISRRLKNYAQKILSMYEPSKIILIRHHNARLLKMMNGGVRFFKNEDGKLDREDNFIDLCFNKLKNALPGCHVINNLDNAVSDAAHPLGISPLHFTYGYYKYCLDCIDAITEGLSAKDEAAKLERIRIKWNHQYAFTYFAKLQHYAQTLNNKLAQAEELSKSSPDSADAPDWRP